MVNVNVVTAMINANGCGEVKCHCCCGKTCDNTDMIEISLKHQWKLCGCGVYNVRVSTDDRDNLFDHLISKNANIKVIEQIGNAVYLKMKDCMMLFIWTMC